MVKLVVDMLGADKGPTELLDGALKAINEKEDLFLYLCGDEAELQAALKDKTYNKAQLEIVNAPEVVSNNDDPSDVLLNKPNASIVKGLKLCKTDAEIGGFVSCGPTGVILASAIMVLGRIGTLRPALLCELRNRYNEPFCITDCGANVDIRPEKYLDFAKMGLAYLQAIGVENPKCALLSNGKESRKGNESTREAHEILRNSGINFLGNIEGTNALSGEADLIVCDGFAGNVLLKTLEGAAKAVIDEWVELARVSMPDQQEAIQKIVAHLYKKYDYNNEGGAVLVGVKKPVIKGHGAASADTIYHIVNTAYQLAKNNFIGKLNEEFKRK